MSVTVGGIATVGLTARPGQNVIEELRGLGRSANGWRDNINGYVVDLAFCTYPPEAKPEWIDWDGLKPGPIGRTRRMFVIWVDVPGLPNRHDYDVWLADLLERASALVLSYVPTRSKTYPVARLATQITELRADWLAHINSDDRLPEGYRVSSRSMPAGPQDPGVWVQVRAWRPGFPRHDLIDVLESLARLDSGLARRLTNQIVDGWAAAVNFGDRADAEEFVRRAAAIGVISRIGT